MDISVGNKTTANGTPTNFIEKGYYAITLNPGDVNQYFGKADRLQQFRTFVHNALLMLGSFHVKYHLYVELSEPKTNSKYSTNGPRLHLHGILYFGSTLSIKNFLLNGVYNLTRWCNYDIDTIEDVSTWHAYCVKQQHIINTDPICNHPTLWKQAKQRKVA